MSAKTTQKNESISIKLLIVEDNPSDAELLVLRLKQSGYSAEWQRVQTEKEYLEALNKNWDLVLSDWRLPQFSGLRALQLLRGKGLETPFIIVSGQISGEEAMDALHQGAQDYLLKDHVEGLGQAVKNALEIQRLTLNNRQMIAELRESEEKYRSLVEHANDGIVILQDGLVRFANRTLLVLAGSERMDDILEKPFISHVHPDERQKLMEHYRQRMNGQPAPEIYESTLLRQDGSPLQVEISAGIIPYQGKPADLVIIRDISERKRAQEEILSLSKFPNENPNPVMRLSRDGRILFANQASQPILETWQRKAGEMVTGDCRELIRQSLQDGQIKQKEIHTTGAIYHCFVAPFGDKDYANVYGLDITHQRRLEEINQARLRLTEFAFSHNLPDLLQKTLDEIGQLTESLIGFYHFVETDEKTLMLQAWSTLTIDRFCKAEGKGAHYGLDKAGVWADAIRQRKAVIHNDYASLPNRKDMPPGHAELKRELVAPIFRDGKITAVLGVGNKDSDYTTQDVELVTYFADIGWELAERKRLDELNRLQASALNAAANAIIITDRDGCIEWANSAFYHLTGYTEDETIGRNPRELVKSDKQDVAVYKNMWETICTGRVWRGEIINRRKSGSEYDEELTITPLLNNEGKVEKFIAIKQDISERKQAEEQLRFSEVRFRQMFNNMNSGVAVYEAVRNGEDFIFKDFNHAAEVIEKTSRGKVIGKSVVSCFPGVIEFGLLDVLKRVWHSGKSEYLAPKLYQDQRIVGWRENFVYKLANGEIVVIYEDVTEKMKAEEQLRYQALLLNQVNDAVIATDERSRMTFYNAAAEETFGWKPEEALGRVSQELMKTEYVGISREEAMQMLIKTGHWRGETTRLRKDGTRIPVEVSNTVVKDEKGKMVGIIGVNRDISERKKLEEILRTNEQSLKEAQKLGRIGNWEFDITNNALTWSDETFELYERDPAQGTPSPDEEGEYYSPEQSKQLREYARQAIETGKGFSYDLEVNLPSGKKAFFAASMRSIKDEKGGVVKLFGTVQDITERKKAEEEIQKRVKQLTTARQIGGSLVETLELEQIYERLYEAAIALLPGSETMFISLYDSVKKQFHCEFAMSMDERMDVSKLPPALLEPPGVGTQSEVVYTRQPLIVENLPERLKKVSMVVNVGDEDEKAQSGLYVPMLAKDEVIGVAIMQSRKTNLYTQDDADMLSLVANTAAIAIQNARLYEQTEKRLQQISALHLIDNAISGSFELDLVFNILMDTLVSQLEVHAGNILQLRTETQELEYLSQRGFRKPPFLHSKIPTSLHLSGMVLHERKPVIVPDLQSEFENFVRAEEIEKEGFKAYVGVPLVAKGELLGILEVFQREIIHPSKNWMDYLETIAGQAAIAIDNHRLFGQLQQSNMELKQAYDATITGWSSALDLRDQETEGHSQRVTEMTLQLARQLGIPERELTDIRYGALLHDIGKIGVSDVVLKKPGPLNEIEWASMRMHPQLAQELLAPVAYLRKSLEIPYCHHEKWDGSGYPRSLKGEQIPLAARIFAVVDVWDALISDRPYRKAWPRQKALEYIKEQRGKHFDPKIVDAFINMGIYNKKSK